MINIMIADDHKMIIDGLTSMLATEAGLQVTGEAANGKELLEKMQKTPVDIILMDINMPELDGIETTRNVKANFPAVRVLILSMYNNPEFIRNLLEVGASGYILKNTGKEELIEAIRQVYAGQNYYGKEVTKVMMESLRGSSSSNNYSLTSREKDVLRLIVEECTTSEIAERLFISTHTVETHRKNLLSKLNLKNTAGLVKYAIEKGYYL
ncbi:response regulator containing a CheY-like receiver domain and an HTH DNA-binding domain [Flammeovirgaceae bacterium 311]|nr:response regulator containing a CheY-like receiver domain and an HTH DNA-binding domain [Flammeovirgaceae bacterium 311]